MIYGRKRNRMRGGTMIQFKEITEENFGCIVSMKVSKEQTQYVATNTYSLAQAWLYRDANDVFPMAVYEDETPVGFILFDVDLEEKSLVIWRIMITEEHQKKGYGTQAIELAIQLARESKRFEYIILDYAPENRLAEHVYQKLGFQPTGEISNGEIVMRLDL